MGAKHYESNRATGLSLRTGVAVVAIMASRHGQRLGDMAAGTTVVKLDGPVALEDTLLVNLDADHVVRFPRVDRLTDADIETLREVLAPVLDTEVTVENLTRLTGGASRTTWSSMPPSTPVTVSPMAASRSAAVGSRSS